MVLSKHRKMTRQGSMPHSLPMRMHGRNQSEQLKSVRSEAGCCSLTPSAPKTSPGCEVSIPGMKLAALGTHYHHLPPSKKILWLTGCYSCCCCQSHCQRMFIGRLASVGSLQLNISQREVQDWRREPLLFL